MSLANKRPSEMTAAEIQQRLYELNGIKPPSKNASRKERNEYHKACFLTLGMKIYGDKGKAHEFMEEQLT